VIDRFSKPIVVGWSDVEREYLRAAMTLLPIERMAAYRDISDMTGRSISAIKKQVYIMECVQQEVARAVAVRSHVRREKVKRSAAG
jgi:hypothetical protein